MNSTERKLIETLWSIQGEYAFMLDDGVVSPKPTWEEFAKWVYEQTQDALSATKDITEIAKRLKEEQPHCGHERRFIVSSDEGTNWCALCELEGQKEEENE